MKVRVGAFDYIVELVKPAKLRKTTETEIIHRDGCINYGNSIIKVADNLSSQRVVSVIWHEMVHAMLDWSSHCQLTSNETLVEYLALSIISAIRDNPELVEQTLGERHGNTQVSDQ